MFHPGSGGYGWMMGGEWGLSHWLFFVVMAAAILYPIGLILKRLGYSPFWGVLAFVPGVNLIALWVLALSGGSSKDKETNI